MRFNIYRAPKLALALAFVAAAATPALAGSTNQIKSFFLNTGMQPNARGRILFVATPTQSAFKIGVSNLVPGSYNVVLDGAVVDTLNVNSRGKGVVVHRSLSQSRLRQAVP